MMLAGSAVQLITAALLDGFSQRGEFEDLARCMNKRLGDLTNVNGPNPDLVRALIECAEKADAIGGLVECAKGQNNTNRLIAALDVSTLEVVTDTARAVERGTGTTAFKERLIDALGRVSTEGLEAVAGADLAKLLAEAPEAEVQTVLLGLIGTLRTTTSREAAAALTPVLAGALRRRIGAASRPRDVTVDLARARLDRIELSGLDLHEADLAFASFRHADLENTNLWRSRAYAVDVSEADLSRSNLEEARWHDAKGTEARFHESRMVSAFLKDADLAGAQFQRARLQGAHLERANLAGARFEDANLADADLRSAVIDAATAASIARARNWEAAKLDDEAAALVRKAGR